MKIDNLNSSYRTVSDDVLRQGLKIDQDGCQLLIMHHSHLLSCSTWSGRPNVQCVKERCTNPGHQEVRAAEFFTVAHNTSICDPSVWNLLHVTILASRIWDGSYHFGKSVHSLGWNNLLTDWMQSRKWSQYCTNPLSGRGRIEREA